MKDIVKVKILGHSWEIRFLERKLMFDGNNGTCWHLHKAIDIATDLTPEETKFILMHEITHAFLGICGKTFETNLDHESICETVAWYIDEMIKLRDLIMKERFGKNYE